MGKNSKLLNEIKDFFELEEGWSSEEVINQAISEIKELKGYAPDEIGLEWDGEDLMVLEDFAREFYQKIINGVCNVLDSFKQ